MMHVVPLANPLETPFLAKFLLRYAGAPFTNRPCSPASSLYSHSVTLPAAAALFARKEGEVIGLFQTTTGTLWALANDLACLRSTALFSILLVTPMVAHAHDLSCCTSVGESCLDLNSSMNALSTGFIFPLLNASTQLPCSWSSLALICVFSSNSLNLLKRSVPTCLYPGIPTSLVPVTMSIRDVYRAGGAQGWS